MTALSFYDPFSPAFSGLFRSTFDDARNAARTRVAGFPVDVHEGKENYTLLANLPGFSKDQIQIEIDGHQVTIRAEQAVAPSDAETKPQNSTEVARVLRHERHSGSFARGFSLANEIDEAQAQASYENGVLSLNLPKKAQPSAKRVAIA